MSKQPVKKSNGQARKPVQKNNNNKKKQAKPKNLQGSSSLRSAPVALGRKNRMGKPNMQTARNGDCRIRHREYLIDLTAESTSPSLFKSQGFPMNPGMSQTFPWLSQIAPRFEKYRFDKLHFIYETEAPTTLGGSLILTADYDASDVAPTSKVQAMAYKNSVRSPPWEECVHMSAKQDLSQQKQYFVRSAANPAGSDIKLYDTGNLFVCSQNVVTGNATLGELYVEYDVLLMTPQYSLPSADGIGSWRITSISGETPAVPFGTTNLQEGSSWSYNEVTNTFTALITGQYSFSGFFVGTVLSGLTWGGSRGADIDNAMNPITVNAAATIMQSTASNGVAINVGDTVTFVVTGTTVTQGNLVISSCTVFP